VVEQCLDDQLVFISLVYGGTHWVFLSFMTNQVIDERDCGFFLFGVFEGATVLNLARGPADEKLCLALLNSLSVPLCFCNLNFAWTRADFFVQRPHSEYDWRGLSLTWHEHYMYAKKAITTHPEYESQLKHIKGDSG
jgi:hypothetical protein